MTMTLDLPSIGEYHMLQTLRGNAGIAAIVGTNTLTGDVQVYPGLAPEGGMPGPPNAYDPPPPYIVVFSQDNGGMNLNGMDSSGVPVWGDGLWTARIDGRAEQDTLIKQLNQLIFLALQNSSAEYPVIGGKVVSCGLETWITPVQTTVDGVLYQSRGGTYRLTVAPL